MPHLPCCSLWTWAGTACWAARGFLAVSEDRLAPFSVAGGGSSAGAEAEGAATAALRAHLRPLLLRASEQEQLRRILSSVDPLVRLAVALSMHAAGASAFSGGCFAGRLNNGVVDYDNWRQVWRFAVLSHWGSRGRF